LLPRSAVSQCATAQGKRKVKNGRLKKRQKTACQCARAWLKIASRKFFCKTGETVFVQTAQTVAAYRENARLYDESALGAVYLNTPRLITNTDGIPVWTWDGEAFGNTPPNSNPNGLGNLTFNLRFPGQYYDAETNLHYNYYRNYNPATGGYLQSDPMGLFGGSFSTYSYVGGNPLRKYDSTGLCAQDISKPCLNALAIAGANASALTRASDNMPIISAAALANGIDPALLAAIGIRETGYQNIAQQGGGDGKGVYQIDTGKNPSVTSAQAYDIQYASNYAANMLSSNFDRLLSQHPNLGYMQLWQATADSYNFGTGNISGNPDTIDVGSTHNNYGSNVMDIMLYCFILGGAK
jgi:RHS repeat-associated protein